MKINLHFRCRDRPEWFGQHVGGRQRQFRKFPKQKQHDSPSKGKTKTLLQKGVLTFVVLRTFSAAACETFVLVSLQVHHLLKRTVSVCLVFSRRRRPHMK